MKKIIIALLVLAGVVCFAADYTPVTEEAASTVTAAVTVGTGGSVVASGTGYVAATAQTDTNVTIAVAGYTPQFVGQLLVGTGSNTIHGAVGTTTNDWVLLTN